jgi:hypothetical protein
MDNQLQHRQDLLIETNVHSLLQAAALLERITDRAYSETPVGFEPHRVGGHLRHILEFYECFLDGIASAHIDYDARRRDETIASSRRAAITRILSVIDRLRNSPELRGDMLVWVRMEDAPPGYITDPFLTSSVARELQVLSSHTIHHFALIAMTLRAHGIAVDADFGMAPSTLRFLASARAKAA